MRREGEKEVKNRVVKKLMKRRKEMQERKKQETELRNKINGRKERK